MFISFLSIGCAIWFASRGKGILWNQDGNVEYSSPARVLLLGMGADEQVRKSFDTLLTRFLKTLLLLIFIFAAWRVFQTQSRP